MVRMGATPDLGKTHDALSFSLPEIVAARSARVRGNEAQPTKTAGRILQGQLDRLPESELAITSGAKPADGGSARGWLAGR
jgi:hypothetical protein